MPLLYRASYQERIDTGFIRHATPEAVAKWFEDNWKPQAGLVMLMKSLPLFGISDDNERRLLEYVATRRRNPLIDLAVARYGYSSRSIQRVFDRGHPSVQAAALLNARGNMRLRHAKQILHEAKFDVFAAMVASDGLSDRDIEDLLARKGIAEGLEGDRYLAVVHVLSWNPRVQAASYQFRKLAWELAETVPTTEAWAKVLKRLVEAVGYLNRDPGVPGVLDRWRTDDPASEVTRSYSRHPFFDLRLLLSNAAPADGELLSSDDLAVRLSFYRRFLPFRFKEWERFVERDGTDFLDAAAGNENLWREEENRQRLLTLCHRAKPRSGDYRSPTSAYNVAEQKFRTEYPWWFAETPTPDRSDETLVELRDAVAELSDKLDHLTLAMVSNPGNVEAQLAALTANIIELDAQIRTAIHRPKRLFG